MRSKTINFKAIVVNSLYMRDKGLCGLCYRPIGQGELFELDHIIEVRNGGLDTFDNLRLVHLGCHKARHQSKSIEIPVPIIKHAEMVRAAATVGTATIKTEVDESAQKKMLSIIKIAYMETGSVKGAAERCGMTIDQLRYFQTKHGFKGKPDKWAL